MANNQSPVIFNKSDDKPDDSLTAIANTLPPQGMSRASQILPFLPFGSTTLWKWSREGLFPAPIRISSTITAWRNIEVLDWLEVQGNDDANNVEEA